MDIPSRQKSRIMRIPSAEMGICNHYIAFYLGTQVLIIGKMHHIGGFQSFYFRRRMESIRFKSIPDNAGYPLETREAVLQLVAVNFNLR
jgi:hypothetical protein